MRRKAKRKALIPKTWTAKDGIDRLPNKLRLKVVEALSRIRMGELPEPNFFNRKYSRAERERIAYELEKSSVSVQDIATLLGMSMWGVVVMLGRVRQQQALGLGPDWASAIFVNEINNQIIDAAWNRARSEATDDEEMAARFRQQATLASKAITTKSSKAKSRRQYRGHCGRPLQGQKRHRTTQSPIPSIASTISTGFIETKSRNHYSHRRMRIS
jgi:hypothetical protein